MAAAGNKIERTIFVKFASIDDGLSETSKAIAASMDKFGNNLKDMAQPVANFANKILKLDAALNTLAAGGLAYAFSESVKFNAAMADVKKVLSPEETKNIDKHKDSILELSNQYGLSAESIAGSLADWKKQGFAVAESIDLVKNSLDFVIAADLSAAQASEIYIASLAGFEVPAEKAVAFSERLGNSINEVANNFAVDGQQIGIFLKGISAQANIAGFSLEEIISIGVPVIETFRDAGEVSNAFKVSLGRLSSESEKVTETMGILGVNQKDANGQFRQGRDIYYDVRTAFKGLSETQQSYYATQLFGLEQSSRMLVALRTESKARKVQEAAIQGQTAAMGEQTSIQKEVSVAMQTTKKQLDIFVETFKNLSKVVGDKYEPAVARVIAGASDILKAIQGAVKSGAFKQIFEFIADYSAKIVEYFDKIKVNLPKALEGLDFSAFLNTLRELESIITTIVKNIFGGDLTSESGLKNAMQTAINAFTKLREVSNTVIKEWAGIIEKIGKMAVSIGDLDSGMVDNIGTWLAMAQKAVIVGGSIITLSAALSGLNSTLTLSRGGFSLLGKGLTSTGGIIVKLLPQFALLNASVTNLSRSLVGKSVGLVAAAGAAGYAFGTLINQIEIVQKIAVGFFDKIHGLFGDSVSEVDKALERQGIKIKEYQDTASKEVESNVNFTGTGSSKKSLSEKIEEMSGFMDGFFAKANETISINADFSDLRAVGDAFNIAIPTQAIEDLQKIKDISSETIELIDPQIFKDQGASWDLLTESASKYQEALISLSETDPEDMLALSKAQRDKAQSLAKLKEDIKDFSNDSLEIIEGASFVDRANIVDPETIETAKKEIEKIEEPIVEVEKKISAIGNTPFQFDMSGGQKQLESMGYTIDATAERLKIAAKQPYNLNVKMTGEASPKKPLTETINDVTKLLDDFSGDDHDTKVNINFSEFTEKVNQYEKDLKELESVIIRPKLELDKNKIEPIADMIYTEFIGYVNGNPIYAPVTLEPDSKKDFQKDIDDIAKDSKFKIDVESKELEETTKRFEALQKTIQKKIDVSGMVDLEKVKGHFEVIGQGLENINTIFDSTSSVLQTSINTLSSIDTSDAFSVGMSVKLLEQMEKENKIRQDGLDMQKLLLESQIAYNKAKEERIKSGEGIGIELKADNLAPHLEMIWFEVLKGLQAKLNAEGAEALIGL